MNYYSFIYIILYIIDQKVKVISNHISRGGILFMEELEDLGTIEVHYINICKKKFVYRTEKTKKNFRII